MPMSNKPGCILFDWGDTLMANLPYPGPMADWPEVSVTDGVPEILALLAPHWHLALATNAADSSEEDIWRALTRGRLDPWIETVYCARTLGVRKPSTAYFGAILDRLNLQRTHVVMVGDSWSTDIEGATKQGMPAVWLNLHSQESRTGPLVQTIHHFSQLPQALTRLLSSSATKDRR